jgi:hypothetical protein
MGCKPVILGLLMSFGLLAGVCFGKYSGGTGEPNDPYLIATPNDLNSIGLDSNDWDKHFKMTADINMAGYSYTTAVIAPDVCEWWGFQGTKFTGIFDGNNFTIDALVIDHNEIVKSFLGLLGYVEGGQIRNLGFNKCFVKGTYEIGILIGYNTGTVTNCFVHGEISGDDYCNSVGGLVGCNTGSIIDCYSTVDVNAGVDCSGIGSLVGDNFDGVIDNCYASGNVEAGPASGPLGGLSGSNFGTISSCFATGSVCGHYYLGGLVGGNDGSITGCFSTGDVSGNDHSWLVGGLIGENYNDGNVSNCYSTGPVDGGDGSNYVGGLVGHNREGKVSNCYSTGPVNSGAGSSWVGGLIGHRRDGYVSSSFWDIETSDCNVSAGGTGLSTTEMQMRSTFADAGWDMVNVWDIGEGQTYPFLRTHLSGDINKDDETNFLDLAILAMHWLDEK